MFLRRLAFWAFLLVLGLFALRHPEGAAHAARAIGHALVAAADGLARFASSL